MNLILAPFVCVAMIGNMHSYERQKCSSSAYGEENCMHAALLSILIFGYTVFSVVAAGSLCRKLD